MRIGLFILSFYDSFSVVPQPVYMNMGELAALAAQKAAMAATGHANNDYSPLADDSPDLKTPTAEDIISVPEQKVIVPIFCLVHHTPTKHNQKVTLYA